MEPKGPELQTRKGPFEHSKAPFTLRTITKVNPMDFRGFGVIEKVKKCPLISIDFWDYREVK